MQIVKAVVNGEQKFLSGKPERWVKSQAGELLAVIRYFDARDLKLAGHYNETPHWALMHVKSGRTDRFDSFKEASGEATKSYGSV